MLSLERRFWQVGLVQKLVFFLLLSLLVFGENNNKDVETSVTNYVNNNNDKVVRHENKESPKTSSLYDKQVQKLSRRLRHSFDALFTSKRKVPNAADPLHNR